MRIDGRALDELRSVKFTPDFTKFAEGSCLVEMGDTVKAGTVLCVLEAMKMENEIPAPKDGKVAQVVVTKGATVGAGDTLVVLA